MTKRKYSKELVDGPNQAASRSMLRGAGFTSEDFTKPFVGIASTGAKVTPCNTVSYTHLTLPTMRLV